MRIFCVPMALAVFVTSGASALATEASYRCSSGTALTARFSPPGAEPAQVLLTFGDGPAVTLPQQASADGGRYVGSGIEFWIKGRSATLRRGSVSQTCSTN